MRFVFVLLAVLSLAAIAERAIPERLTAMALSAERGASGLETRQAKVDGFTLPYLEGGKGEALLLIHGFAGDKDNFSRIARYLTPHYRVLIPDLPGFGEAMPRNPDARYGMAEQVARLHTLLVQLGVTRVHLGGNSMGGYIAAQFAATYPDMVASVWLLDPAGVKAAYDTPLLKRYRDSGDSPFLASSEDDIDRMLAVSAHKPPYIPMFARVALGRRAMADRALHQRILVQMYDSPLLEQAYQSIPVPAFIVWGAHDQVLNPAAAQNFKALFPNSRVKIMQSVGHVPMLEAPEQTAVDYLAFRRAQ